MKTNIYVGLTAGLKREVFRSASVPTAETHGTVYNAVIGPSAGSPYVPSWLYPRGPKMCPCGHHEGYHNDAGKCLLAHKCACKGLPKKCLTDLNEMI